MAEYFKGLNSFRVLGGRIQNNTNQNKRKETQHKTRMLSYVSSCLFKGFSLRKGHKKV
jgi:hypothetical protein